MELTAFVDSTFFQWVLLPLFIFTARVCDVSMDTIRIMFLNKGNIKIAPILGFFQILVWLLAIRSVFTNLSNPICYIAYAGGFAVGTYAGIWIEAKLAIGHEVIRIITRKDAGELIKVLNAKNYGVTSMSAKGATGDVSVIFMVAKRNEIDHIIQIIHRYNPKAFYTIENVKAIKEGVFPQRGRRIRFASNK